MQSYLLEYAPKGTVGRYFRVAIAIIGGIIALLAVAMYLWWLLFNPWNGAFASVSGRVIWAAAGMWVG